MGDWTAERAFRLSPFDVDVDPLPISAEVGVCSNHFLGYLDRGTEITELVRNLSADTLKVVEPDTLQGNLQNCEPA